MSDYQDNLPIRSKPRIGRRNEAIKKVRTIISLVRDDRPIVKEKVNKKKSVQRYKKNVQDMPTNLGLLSEPIEAETAGVEAKRSYLKVQKRISSSDSDEILTEESPDRSEENEHSSMDAGTSESDYDIKISKNVDRDFASNVKGEETNSIMLTESDPDNTMESSGSDNETKIKKTGKIKTKSSKNANIDKGEREGSGKDKQKPSDTRSDVKKNKTVEKRRERSVSEHETEIKEKIPKYAKALSNINKNRNAEKNEMRVEEKAGLGKRSEEVNPKSEKNADVDGSCYEPKTKKKRGRPFKNIDEKSDSSQSNNDRVVEKKNTSEKHHAKNKSKEKESHIIVNSTNLSDLTASSSKGFDENSISSFSGMSTIKPQHKREQILIHRPISGDVSTITLMRGELNNRFGSKLTDEIMGRRRSLTFTANSEVLYEPAVEETSPELIESDDDVFLHLRNHVGKIIFIRHK